MAELFLDKKTIIGDLTKSPHGRLADYVPVGVRAAREDADFFAHLLAWDAKKGEVRDAHCALPVLALAGTTDAQYVDNALAHLASLNPRLFIKALDFAKDARKGWEAEAAVPESRVGKRRIKARAARAAVQGFAVPQNTLRRLVARYLRDGELAEFSHWEKGAVQHRASLKTLYGRYHIKPSQTANQTLMQGQATGGRFAAIRSLNSLTPVAAADVIRRYQLPFLVVRGALGTKAADPDLAIALIRQMSPTELVTEAKKLEDWGAKTVPAVRAALAEALERAGKDTTKKARGGSLKATAAAEKLAASDPQMAAKLQALQETQLSRMGVEGDWLVLGDKSGSMSAAIDAARHVASTLAKLVKGKIYLVFFDTTPRMIEATGRTYEALRAETRGITANGSTSIGCGLKALLEKRIVVDGITIVSDGEENQLPHFADVYQDYCKKLDVEPTVYFYHVSGSGNPLITNCRAAKIDLQTFDVRQGTDYYALPNLVQTMRVGRYTMIDEILATPLKTLDGVLARTKGQEVMRYVGDARLAVEV